MRRLVFLASAIVLVDTMFYAVVAPLLPHYVDELGLSHGGAGILAAAYPAGTLLGSLPAGLIAARFGPRRTVLVALALLCASSLAFGFARHAAVLDIARFVQGIAGACSWAGALSWLVGSAPAAQRGQMIGTALGAAVAGGLLGPVVGGIAELTSPQLVFSSVVVLCATLAVWALKTPPPPIQEAPGLAALWPALRRPDLLVAMWLVGLPAIAFGAVSVIGALRLDELGAGGAAVGATFLIAAGVEAAISPAIGRLSDRRGRLLPIRVGLLISTVLLCVFTLPNTVLPLAVSMVAITAALGLFWGPAMALVSDGGEAAGLHLGMGFALVNLAWAGGQMIGSAGGGALSGGVGDAGAPLAIAAISLVTLLGIMRRSRVRSVIR
ncbi:MAG: transporter [Solirubrobacterales bacterium]|nr:transporter [Solirubrobacterales bacterium]